MIQLNYEIDDIENVCYITTPKYLRKYNHFSPI